jgi:hypothetical protein
MIEAQKVKEDRRRNHSRAGKEKPKAERKSEFGVRYPHSGDRLTIRRDCHQGAEVRGVCCGLWCYPVYVYVHHISRYYNVLHLRFLGAVFLSLNATSVPLGSAVGIHDWNPRQIF